MRHYIPNWGAVGISKERYLELIHFCRQYPEWKTEAASLIGPSGVKIDGMPHGSSSGDPVAAAAERRARLLEKIQMVDDCAAAVGGGRWYTALIQNICLGRPYVLLDSGILPTSDRNSFFKAKKAFFVRLDVVEMMRGGAD